MFEQRRRPPQSWIPIAAGFAWLAGGAAAGWLGFAIGVLPGTVLLSTGMATLLHPGDARIPHIMGLGGLLGALCAFPTFLVGGFFVGLGLLALSAASLVTSGWLSVAQSQHPEEVPIPDLTIALAAQVAVDNVLLGMLSLTLPMPAFSEAERIRDEAQEALALFRERGWLEKPESYHRTPPPLESPTVRPRPMLGLDVEHLSFESGYEPHAEEPGRERWLGYERNRTAHAWVLRHDAPERPWLCCIHGYQMGNPKIDLRAFEVARLHHSMGMNVILPVLPLHGPRAYGRISGDGFLSADFMDTVHAEAQAMWDIRRALSWARAQGATKVGAFGLSLGGYNTALLACLDEDLACAIPGIPATDFARITWRHGPPLQLRYSETIGVKLDDVDALLRVVSPLALEPKVDHERRYLFGAVGDLLVPAELVRDLWRHWDRPRLEWYQGGHVTFGAHPQIRRLVDSALRESGLTP